MRSTTIACVAACCFLAGAVASSPQQRRARPARYNTTSSRSNAAGVINVALVPHTHDDVGWLKTVDQYYIGSAKEIAGGNVQSIVTASVRELLANPDRRFSYVEQAFFQRWWAEQTPEMQTSVRGLISSGQLEMINGGWCMHDEANPSFIDMIDQTTLGHRFLRDEFGVRPKVTWQIDPFGHSGFQASYMSSPSAGFAATYFARSDYADFSKRQKELSTEFFWAPSPSRGNAQATMGGIFPHYYYPPTDLNYGGSNDPPIQDDPTLEDYNVDERVASFLAVVAQTASVTLGGNGQTDIMLLEGTDFSYENAVTWFSNIDKLIHYTNLLTSTTGVHAYYGTPSVYTDAKLKNVRLPLRSDDMMPYADDAHAVWAGYFTSRTALKHYIRVSSGVHQALRQAQAFALPPADLGPSNALYRFERAQAVAQHHDAVAGTSKQAVAYDYAKRIAQGRADGDVLMRDALNVLTGASGAPLQWVSCDLANATICSVTEAPVAGSPIMLALWNSQAQARPAAPVRISVGLPSGVVSWAVQAGAVAPASGVVNVPAQLFSASAADHALREDYYGAAPAPVAWLAFTAALPPAGFAVFALTPSAAAVPSTTFTPPTPILPATSASITNDAGVKVTFDASGRMSSMTTPSAGTTPMVLDAFWYNSSVGGPDDGTGDWGQSSGAYIFRPNSSTPFPVSAAALQLESIVGPVVSEMRLTWPAEGEGVTAPWVTAVVRLWTGASSVEVEWSVGSIPHADGLGKEVIVRYSSGLASGGVFYTDSNGRDALRRVRNARPDWILNLTEPVADNYYPVNTFASLSDASTGVAFSVVTDRTHAGSSMQDGALELMVHRRLQADDNRGVSEPLNETGVNGLGLIARGVHVLCLDSAAGAGAARRGALQNALFPPVVAFGPGAARGWLGNFTHTFSGLASPLPPNVHLLTLHAQSPTSLLLRLSHSFAVGEDAALSTNVTVSLAGLLASGGALGAITGVVELTLTGNQALADAPQVTYNVNDGSSVTLPIVPPAPTAPDYSITIAPLDIRTFAVTLAATDAREE